MMKNKETIEEAAMRLYPDAEQWTDRHIFITAANWQANQQLENQFSKYGIGIFLVILFVIPLIFFYIK